MIKTIDEASKELAGQWLPAPELMPQGWPENIEAVTDEFRLSIFRTLSEGKFNTDLLRLVTNGKIPARSATGSYLAASNEPTESTLVDVVEAKTAFEAEGMKFQYAENAASSGAPESAEQPQYSPRIGWQIAMFEAWPAMRKLHGREPSAAEAIRYLKKNDTSGTILGKGGENELWWKPNRGSAKEVQFKTVESCISGWRTSGKLPA